jgi:hypothetical protein
MWSLPGGVINLSFGDCIAAANIANIPNNIAPTRLPTDIRANTATASIDVAINSKDFAISESQKFSALFNLFVSVRIKIKNYYKHEDQ